MRVAVLADIHGNLPALDAALCCVKVGGPSGTIARTGVAPC